MFKNTTPKIKFADLEVGQKFIHLWMGKEEVFEKLPDAVKYTRKTGYKAVSGHAQPVDPNLQKHWIVFPRNRNVVPFEG